MANPSVDKPPQKERGRGAKVGRQVALALYAAAGIYIVVAAFVSVIPQIFWPAVAEIPSGVSCEEALGDLRDELLSGAATRLERAGSNPDGLGPENVRIWLDGWDGRHRALQDTCADSEAEWETAGDLRRRLHFSLGRMDEVGALAHDLQHIRASGEPQDP